MAEFRLSKWYLDCVTAEGHAAIAYTGAVEFGPLRLHYSSLLEDCGASRSSLRAQPQPVVNESSIAWRGLGVDGEWTRGATELRERVFESEAGCIDWHCLVPSGTARLGGYRGLGYAERLTMTVPPWNMPIRTLRWGRFTSDAGWIVWIDWLGEFERRLVYRNGELASAPVVGDDRIEFEDGSRLALDRSLILRDSTLGTTIPWIRDTFPGSILGVHECKWRSRARLECPDGSAVEDWAIHEVVEWPH